MFDDHRTYEYKVEVLTLPDEQIMSTRALEGGISTASFHGFRPSTTVGSCIQKRI